MSEKTLPSWVENGRLRSFGRMASRMSIAAQEKLDNRLQKYAISLQKDSQNPTKITSISDDLAQIIANSEKLVLEVGMGNGFSLFNRAKNSPTTNFIGIEVYKNGLKSLAHKLEQQEVAGNPILNLKLSSDDAREVMAAMPDGCLDEFVLLYPDPWPKTKHKKRRIVNREFLDEVARLLKPSGELFMATDITDYALHMLREVLPHGAFAAEVVDEIGSTAWQTPPAWWTVTKYETKALKVGRKPWYLTFKKI